MTGSGFELQRQRSIYDNNAARRAGCHGKFGTMSETLINSEGTQAANAALIKDTTTRDFMRDVIEESRRQPVLVDFWAPWCGPCKQLAPALEKVVKEAKGAVKLVKLNIDEHPAIPGQMGIQSIPAVFAFKNGQPIDGFMGAVQESQIKEFISRIAGAAVQSEAEVLLQASRDAFDAGDYEQATRGFAAVLREDPQNSDAIAGLAESYIALGDLDLARQTLALVPAASLDRMPLSAVKSKLDLADQTSIAGDREQLFLAVEANPEDHQARFDYAVALNAAGLREQAVDELIHIVKRKRDWNDDAARKQLVTFFEAWGPTDENTVSGRRKLSSVLFS